MLDGVTPFPEEFAARYRERGYWEGRPLFDGFTGAFAKYSDRVALVDGLSGPVTYAELSQRAPWASETEVSDRELRILELAAEGKTNYQIGREIGLSEHTVKGAISHLLARLRLRHRTEAVVHALRLGWISAPRAEPQRILDRDEDLD